MIKGQYTKINELENKIEELEKDIKGKDEDKLKEEIRKLKDNLTERENEFQVIFMRSRKAEEEVNKLKKIINDNEEKKTKEDKSEEIKKEIEDKEYVIKGQYTRINELENKIKEIESKTKENIDEKYKEEINKLKNNLDGKEKEFQDLFMKSVKTEEEVKRLKKMIRPIKEYEIDTPKKESQEKREDKDKDNTENNKKAINGYKILPHEMHPRYKELVAKGGYYICLQFLDKSCYRKHCIYEHPILCEVKNCDGCWRVHRRDLRINPIAQKKTSRTI